MGIKISGGGQVDLETLAPALLSQLEKEYEDRQWELRAQRSVPWWMRLQPFGFVTVAVNLGFIWGWPWLTGGASVSWGNVILYMMGALATALWAAGKVRLRNTRRWLALQRAVGVDP